MHNQAIRGGLALMMATCLLTGCSLPQEVARFHTSDGGWVSTGKAQTANVYFLMHPPGSGYAPTLLPELSNMENVVPAGDIITNDGETIFLLRGYKPGCQLQHVLVVASVGRASIATLPDCTRPYVVLPQPNGHGAYVMEENTQFPTYFVYRGNTLSGPRRVAETSHTAAVYRPTSQATSPRPATTMKGINLDNLPVPSDTPAVNLDVR